MVVYIVIALVFLFLGIAEVYLKREREVRYLLLYLYSILGFLLCAFVAVRECGFDFYNYQDYFKYLSTEAWQNNAEVLNVEKTYAYLNRIVGDYRLLIVLMAFSTLSLQLSFYYRYSPYPLFTIFLILGVFLYPFWMGQYRQALAISIFIWAVIHRHNKVRACIIIGIASLFHLSAIIGCLIFFIP